MDLEAIVVLGCLALIAIGMGVHDLLSFLRRETNEDIRRDTYWDGPGA